MASFQKAFNIVKDKKYIKIDNGTERTHYGQYDIRSILNDTDTYPGITVSGIAFRISSDPAGSNVSYRTMYGGNYQEFLGSYQRYDKQLFTVPNDLKTEILASPKGTVYFRMHWNSGGRTVSYGPIALVFTFYYTESGGGGGGGGGGGSDDPTSETVPDYIDYGVDSHTISAFVPSAANWTNNGEAMLTPTVCRVTEEAGGQYELEMEHPMTPDNRWQKLQPDWLIRAPVPVQSMAAIDSYSESAIWESGSQMWKTGSKVNVYSAPNIRKSVTYASWAPYRSYTAGDKVTYNGQNYQCTASHGGLAIPPSSSSLWKKISNYTGSGVVIGSVNANVEYIMLHTVNSTWQYMRTKNGSVVGYIQSGGCSYVRELSDADIHNAGVSAREIRDQMFRIYQVERDRKANRVTVRARHISYDKQRQILGICDVYERTPPGALINIQGAMLSEDDSLLLTNITEGTITEDYSYKNVIAALLDPDTGIVQKLRARVIRDNRDIFILRNGDTDYGYKISYGVNLTGVKWQENVDEVITRVVPVGRDEDGSDLLLPDVFVDSAHYTEYAVDRVEKLDVSEAVNGGKYTDEQGVEHTRTLQECYDMMIEEAKKEYSEKHIDIEKVSLQVEFVKLGDTAEYAQYKNLEKLALYDTVTITDAPLGLEVKAQVKKIVYDCILGRYESIELGDPFSYVSRGTVPGYQISKGAISAAKFSSDLIKKLGL